MLRRLVGPCLAVALVVACTPGEGPSPAATGATTPAGTATPTQTGTAGTTARGAGIEGSVAVEVTRRHPANVTATVTGITVEGRAIYIDLEVFNGSDHTVYLAVRGEDVVRLIDDLDNSYPFQRPEDNPKLELESGGEMEARLAFLGPLVDGATSLDLLMNYNTFDRPADDSNPNAEVVSFTFEDLPVPGT